MKKEYYQRGKKVSLEEIPGVLAIKLDATVENLEDEASRLGSVATLSQPDEITTSTSEEEQKAFSQAGYVFVKPNEETRNAVMSRTTPENVTSINRTFRDDQGHIFVDTKRLTIKFKPGLSKEEINTFLAKANLKVVNEFKFSPSAYEVQVVDNRDSLDVSMELSNNENLDSAPEPVFKQFIPSRFKPTDPSYSQQWQWKNSNSLADVHAESAWDITRGEGIKIAVIDNGIDVSHPDLAPAINSEAGHFDEDASGNVIFRYRFSRISKGESWDFLCRYVNSKS